MKAAVVVAFSKLLVLREWGTRTPGAGQILVKTGACGVCHTDLHGGAYGMLITAPSLDFIVGHTHLRGANREHLPSSVTWVVQDDGKNQQKRFTKEPGKQAGSQQARHVDEKRVGNWLAGFMQSSTFSAVH